MTPDRAQLALLLEVTNQLGEICLELAPALTVQQQAIKQQLEACLEETLPARNPVEVSQAS